MSMEKYGTDLKNLPATDDQIRTLTKLASITGSVYTTPANRQEADDEISRLGSLEEN